MRRIMLAALAVVLGLGLWSTAAPQAKADDTSIGKYFYYPYYYFPHNYWPATTPKWPEPPGMPYMPPPAYQAYPAYLDPYWNYPMWHAMKYYRGSHFWLDQF